MSHPPAVRNRPYSRAALSSKGSGRRGDRLFVVNHGDEEHELGDPRLPPGGFTVRLTT
ncbi:hypothetical protein [Streptosporangium sp. NPDC000509]|uniref:hypothetical protein n=1 Tax=Streptosporangium sp. NPDC000509 TaxID=3366186 RepID=UPI0036A5E81A